LPYIHFFCFIILNFSLLARCWYKLDLVKMINPVAKISLIKSFVNLKIKIKIERLGKTMLFIFTYIIYCSGLMVSESC
jgi:hypothetical protein